MSSCDIFIKTCFHDAAYHVYCLESIGRFCTGFRDTVVVGGEHPRGYLYQQVIKMHADTYTDADYILVTDSDTLFTEPVSPESFMVDGKPIWLYTPWTPEMLAHSGTKAWHDCMQEFFGVTPHAELMRRQPFMFPRHVLQSLREFCYHRHGVSIEDYVMSRGSFSEWNVLGFHCWLHHRDDFHWIDTSVDPLPPLRVHQFWSQTPIEQNLHAIQQILAV